MASEQQQALAAKQAEQLVALLEQNTQLTAMTKKMSERIEAQIERFAPGFRERILARHSVNAREMEQYNANYIGGDINGGMQDLTQMFTRPTISLASYSTPDPGLYICSSSTPPGGGVHGMCGYFAASAALRHLEKGTP